MRKSVILKVVITTLLLGMFSFSIQMGIKANSFSIRCKSKIYIVENGENTELDGSNLELQTGSLLRFTFWLSSESEDNSVKINFDELSGIDSVSSIKIDGKEAKGTELIESVLLTDGLTKIEVEGKYSGIALGDIKSKISVTSLDNNKEGNHSFGFSYFNVQISEGQEKKYTVNFYGIHSNVIDSKLVKENETVIIPEYTLVGYDIVGFNETADGSGKYFSNGHVDKDSDWFVVVKPKEFVISYYVDGELYTAKKLVYNEDAFYIAPPQKEGYEFVEWFGTLHNIQNNVSLYAVYKSNKTQEYYISETPADIDEENEDYISVVDYKKIKVNKQTNQGDGLEEYYLSITEDEDIAYINNNDLLVNLQTTLSNSLKTPLGIGLFLLVIVLIVFFFYKFVTKAKQRKSNL